MTTADLAQIIDDLDDVDEIDDSRVYDQDYDEKNVCFWPTGAIIQTFHHT